MLITAIFELQLKQASHLIKKYRLSCVIICSEEESKDISLQQIIKHLKIAGLGIILTKDNLCTQNFENSSNYRNIYLLSQENIDSLLLNGSFEIKKSDILLVTDSATQILISKKSLRVPISKNIINLSTKDQYFQNVFYILKELIIEIDIEPFINKFQKIKESIIDSKGESISELLIDNQKSEEIKQGNISSSLTLIINRKRLKIFFIFILTILFLLIILITIFVFKLPEQKFTPVINDSLIINSSTTSELEHFFSLIKDNAFSADNITLEQIHKNHSIVKQIERWFTNANKTGIQEYFNSPEILSDELVTYLYTLHALANYYTYYEHDGEKARSILAYAKNLTENYVINRSKIKLDFESLGKENLFIELTIIKNLAEMYTRIIYSLGRTYLYQGDKKEAISYFEISQYLGERLKLFEGYLSYISGIGIIQKEEIDIEIKSGNYKTAEQKLKDLIEMYKKLKDCNIEYRLDYEPNTINPKTIIPRNHTYNRLECSKRIAELYSKLIVITDCIAEKVKYLDEIVNQFIRTSTSPDTPLLQLKSLPNKKIAYIYNSLGNILLELYGEPINLNTLTNIINNDLQLTSKDYLETNEELFKVAESYSRNSDFTKADAYEGLAKVYELKLQNTDNSRHQKQELQKKINFALKKSKELNQKLNRKPPL